jgi:chromosome transmission fidelity protein 1
MKHIVCISPKPPSIAAKSASDLIPTLLSLSSVRLTSNILSTSLKQVSVYYQKFRNRLSAMHALHLKRLLNFLDAFQKVAMDWMAQKSSAISKRQDTEVMTVPDFIHRLGRKVEGINLLEIESYLKRSKVRCINLIRCFF